MTDSTHFSLLSSERDCSVVPPPNECPITATMSVFSLPYTKRHQRLEPTLVVCIGLLETV